MTGSMRTTSGADAPVHIEPVCLPTTPTTWPPGGVGRDPASGRNPLDPART